MIIAIDGPAASGKSTTALKVAEELGITYLDTGAMYRAVTLAVLDQDINMHDETAMESLLSAMNLNIFTKDGETVILLNGKDVSEKIRTVEVTANVSAVSALPKVRDAMVKIQRNLGRQNDCVVEGRDIGTVVFPGADYKFYMVADYEARARRRQLDLETIGEKRSLEELIEDLKIRDKKDSTRLHSPLTKAAGAVEVDTTHLSVDEQVRMIVDIVNSRR